MTGSSVPPSPPGEPHVVATDLGPRPSWFRRHRRFAIAVAVATLVGAALIAAIFLVQLPYYLIEPGSVRPAEQRIEVSGADSFETEGDVLFTTIFITRATPALMIKAWLDDAIEVRSQEEVYPEGDTDESRERNFQRMDLSKLNATMVALETLGVDARLGGDGVRVLGLAEGAPAASVLEAGDVIVAVDGSQVGVPTDIADRLEGKSPGDRAQVVVQRGDERHELDVVLAAATDDPAQPALGIYADAVAPRVDSVVEVEVDSGDVSGPSAGLAWTLAIIDRLTPGSITAGRDIAVTGEMRPDGTIGPIGGIAQKVAAVKRAGIDLFLYPAETSEQEQAAMRDIAGDEVELRPVGTIDDAVEVLVPGGLEMPA